MGEVFGPPNATPESLRAAADGFRAKIVAEPPAGSPGMLEQMFTGMARDETAQAELSRVTVPFSVLYVQAPNVPLPPEQFDAAMRRSYANAPNVRLTRVEDSRHFIQMDQPARFVAEVDAFMRRK